MASLVELFNHIMPLEFVKSQKNHDLLKYNGFLFRKEKVINSKIIWKCIEYRTHGCRGRCNTLNDSVVLETCHNHVADIAKIQAKATVQSICSLATSSQATSHQIIAEATANVSTAVTGKLPSISTIKRSVQRARQRENGFLPTPPSLTQLEIPEQFRFTVKGERFLLFDSGPSDDRIFIFSTTRNLELLAAEKHWYSDGTFKTAPPLFS